MFLLETLIVWTEPSNQVDMALSFQEAEGCALIWYVYSTDHARVLTRFAGLIANLYAGNSSMVCSNSIPPPMPKVFDTPS